VQRKGKTDSFLEDLHKLAQYEIIVNYVNYHMKIQKKNSRLVISALIADLQTLAFLFID
jgi:hypothetical protein